jgi:hypothetical protein
MIKPKPEHFTVLTVTKRKGWEGVALNSFHKQTIKPAKWIIVSEKDITLPHIKAPEKIRLSNLNASNNAGLRLVETPFVIFWQDFIELDPDCFEKLLLLADKRTFVTTCTPNDDGTDDGRYTGLDGHRFCLPAEWEENVAIAPMKAIKELGGYDEEYDNGWAWNNVNVAERAAILGYRFIIDETNRPKLLFHVKEPDLHPDIPLNGIHHQKVMQEIRAGKRPIKNTYL